MPTDQSRDACPGYFYASAITQSLIRDFKKVPLSDKEQRGEKLLVALDYGRTLLNVAEPLTRGTPHEGVFAALYQQLQNLARPWCEESKEQFIESSKTELVLDVLYEVQRELREIKRKRDGLEWCAGCALERTAKGKLCDTCSTGKEVAA